MVSVSGKIIKTLNNCPANHQPFVLLLKQAQLLTKKHKIIMNTKKDYLLLFVGNEWYNELSYPEIKKVAEAAHAWLQGLMDSGKVKNGQGLAREGAHIMAKTGRVISDGPYAESKEAVGGFIVVEAESLEEAVAIAKTNPTIPYGTAMEVRPLNRGEEDCPLYKRLREFEQELAPATA
jgi:hypothetical protein